MAIVPIEPDGHKNDVLLVILGPDNLERMRRSDLAEVNLREVYKAGCKLVHPIIKICIEEDENALRSKFSDVKALVNYPHCGWEFRPDLGDHDRGPEKLGFS
jgi:hypothetical protein